jgi:hypothetical protein
MPAYRAPTHSRLLQNSGISLLESLNATIERAAEYLKILAQSLRRTPLELAHPTISRHYPKKRALLTEASAIMGKVAREDRAVPPAYALRSQREWLAPKRLQRIS